MVESLQQTAPTGLNMRSPTKSRAELKAELKRIRSDVSVDVESLGGRLNMTQRVQNSLKEHQTKWIIGGVALGLSLAILSGNRKKSRKSDSSGGRIVRTLFLGLLGSATKQIIRESAPSLIKMARSGLEQWTGSLTEQFSNSEEPPISPTENFRED